MTPTTSSENIGQRLAAARLQRGLAQTTVAQSAGLAPSYLSRLENGKVHPTFRTVMQIAQALGAGLEEIAGAPVAKHRRGPCPVTEQGQCLLDLVHSVADHEHYSPREIRLMRRLGRWLKTAEPGRVRAMELILDDLTSAAESAASSTAEA
jgi:transcriptional regulator with XRE-family HTH domain